MQMTINTPSLPVDGFDLKAFLFNVETGLIQQALNRTSQNRTHAAKLLGMHRTTLVEKMRIRGLIANQREKVGHAG